MNKTLYISDLDGTLLNAEAALSPFTTQALRDLLRQGLCFSVATARTWESTQLVLRDILPLPAPIVLLNGALVYDTQTQTYIKEAVIPQSAVMQLLHSVKAHGQTGFLYSFQQGNVLPFHEPLTRPLLVEFRQERLERYCRFTETDDLAALAGEHIIYFTTQDSYEALAPLRDEAMAIPGLDCGLYIDDYHPGNWYLECFSSEASKGNAVRFLRTACGFETIVGFGDNFNDLPLFAACDEGYAVANARNELKACASGIVGANTEDGVVRFLVRNAEC